MTSKACAWAFALAAGLFAASGAAAQGAPQEEGAVELTVSPRRSSMSRSSGSVGPLRLYGGFRVGVAGNFVNQDGPGDLDARATPGIQAGVDYVVMDYFAIGGETRLNWAKPEDADDRIMLWDLAVKPRGRYQLTNLPLEVYGTLPVGLSISNWPDDSSGVEGGAGATLGLFAGATYFFTGNMGLNAEMGAMFHWIHGESDLGGDVALRLAQFSVLQLNFVYAL